jgi:hypothetical protein
LPFEKELSEAFKKAIEACSEFNKALSDPSIENLADFLSAIGKVKEDPIYETISTALFSILYEIGNFGKAMVTVPSLEKDIKPKLNGIIKKLREELEKIREELLKAQPDYKKLMEATGNIFFIYHELSRLRSRLTPLE